MQSKYGHYVCLPVPMSMQLLDLLSEFPVFEENLWFLLANLRSEEIMNELLKCKANKHSIKNV